jgi:hypothetical protein
MLVPPPGTMKKHLLGGFHDLPGVKYIDQITPQTFLSGQIDDPRRASRIPASLLHRLGAEGMIVYPDFSTVLAMKQDNKASVLADMRRIYDGELSKEFGTSDNLNQREWRGRITFVVAVTPDIDGHYSIFQTLGERFVMIRWPRAGGVEAALAAMEQNNQAAKDELRIAVGSLFSGLAKIEPELSNELRVAIANLTEVAVRGRTHVPRVGYSKEIIYVPEPESATRLAQQLAQLAKGAALIAGRDRVETTDYKIVQRVALDCIPPSRRKILDALRQGGKASDAALPRSTLSYAKEELEAHGLMQGDGLSELALTHLSEAGLMATSGRA